MPDSSLAARLWSRLPLVARAILSGAFVFMILQSGWSVFFIANLKIAPSIPWSAPIALLYLWLVFQYFNGRWKPSSTSASRRDHLRARRLGRREWPMAVAAIGAVVIFIIATTILSYRLIEVPAEETGLADATGPSLYVWLAMISIVAGVSEEAGFRGYMQTPLEKRYGAVFAVAVSAVMFWLAHLNHANGVPRVAALCIMGGALGSLTVCARSIVPSMIAHAMTDGIVFIGSTASIGPDYLWNPVPLRESGLDRFFWATIVAILVSGLAGSVVLRELARITPKSAPAPHSRAQGDPAGARR